MYSLCLGILERRKGGHAMKLTYFVSPYDLIDQENKSCEALSLDAVILKKLGHSVTVCMEGSTAHKLPTSSIITVNRGPTGKRYEITDISLKNFMQQYINLSIYFK